MNRLTSIAGLAALALCVSCDDAAPPPFGDVAADTSADAAFTPPPLRFGTTPSDLFDPRRVPGFELTLPAERWAWLEAHALDESWEPAELRFEGELFGRVAIRFKGGNGTLLSCVDATTKRIHCKKLSLKLKFTAYDPARRFFGLKRLNLHAMTRDRSLVREHLAYDLFAALGIAAPRHAYATVTINGEPYGLYGMVEELDGRFTDERWPDHGDGNLYKGIWPGSDRVSDYAAALVTNTDTTPPASHDAILRLAAALRTPIHERRAALAPFVDLDRLARTLAVYDAIQGWDGPLAFWTCAADAPPCSNQNVHWYQLAPRRAFEFIPWDMDQTFVVGTPLDFVPHWTLPISDCTPTSLHDTPAAIGALPPACDPLIAAVAEDPSAYREAIAELLGGPMSPTTRSLERRLDALEALIAPHVASDKRGPGTASWQAELAELRALIPLLRARLERLANGDPPAAAGLTPWAPTTFEDTDPLGVQLGLRLRTNPSTALTATLGDDGALAGERDLRLGFTFDNGAQPFDIWAQAGIRFRAGPQRLLTARTLSFVASSDTPRRLRVELDAALYDFAGALARHGWEVELTPEPTLITLPLAEASLPAWANTGSVPPLATIRSETRGLILQPLPTTVTVDGWLPSPETGQIRVDDITIE